jgi:isomerase DpgB
MNQVEGAKTIAEPLTLRLDGDVSTTLAGLANAVHGLCDAAEDRSSAVVVRLAVVSPDAMRWPGRASIQDVTRWERAVRRLERLAAPSIAVAEGVCGGPALDLLLATDYRLASPDARLRLPIEESHVWPGMALHRLANQLGVASARRLLLGANDVSAERALAIGLIDEVTAKTTEALRTALARLGVLCGKELAVRRQLLLEAPATSFEEALATHLAACDRELRRRNHKTLDEARRAGVGNQ